VPIPTFPLPSTVTLSILPVCKIIAPIGSVALRVIPAVSSFKIVRSRVISRVDGPPLIPPISIKPAVVIFPPSSILKTFVFATSVATKSVPVPATEIGAHGVVVPIPTLPCTSKPFVGAAV